MAWFRFYSDTIHDRKIRRLSLAHRWLWVTILCLAKESPEQGLLLLSEGVPVTEDDLSDSASIPAAQVKSGLEILERQRMVHRDKDGVIVVTHWDDRQFTSDDSSDRVKRYRQRKRNGDVTLQESDGNGDVTPPETEYRDRVQSTDQKDRMNSLPAHENVGSEETPSQALARLFPAGVKPLAYHDIQERMSQGLEVPLLNVAYRIAVAEHARDKPSYMAGVLRGFLNDGITTVAQYESVETARQTATGGVTVAIHRGRGSEASRAGASQAADTYSRAFADL